LCGKECGWLNKTGPNAPTYDVIENDYYSRSIINDEILKKKHILFIGDSFVFGHGVPHADSMGVHFEELLNNDEYCIINLGIPGAAYDHSFLRLQQWCNQFGNNIHSVYFGLSHPSRKMHVQQHQYGDAIATDNLYDSNNVEIIDSVLQKKSIISEIKDFFLQHIPRETTLDSDLAQSAYFKYMVFRPAIDILSQWDSHIAMLKTQGRAYRFNICTFPTVPGDFTTSEHNTIKQHVDVPEGFPKFTYGLLKMSEEKLDNTIHSVDPINDHHWNSLGNKQVASNLFKETKHWYDKRNY
jgi:hypothetical protein